MNILLVSSSALTVSKEATYITFKSLCDEYTNEGHNVFVSAKNVKGAARYEKIGNMKIYRSGLTTPGRMIKTYFTLKKIEKENNLKFDISHSFSSSPIFVLLPLIINFLLKVKTIHTLKSYPKEVKWTNGNFLLNLVDKITVPTRYHLETLRKKGIRSNIEMVRSSFRENMFYPRDKIKLKAKYGYSGQKIVFFYGSLYEAKGSRVLMDSISKIVQNFKDVKFILAPRNTQYAHRYVDEVKGKSFEKSVEFIMRDIQIEEYVAMSDIVVLPYIHLEGTEGNPSCLIESMASKTLVVSTDFPEIREIAQDCIIFAQPGDVNSLISKLSSALNSNNNSKINNAYNKVKEFSSNIIATQFLGIYSRIKHQC
jgi:glycosyltransferase involved in cell wall biosynthesis